MALKKPIYKILEECSKFKTKQEKIDFLRQNDSDALRTVLHGALGKDVVWDLPEGAPPFKRSDGIGLETMLYTEIRRLYLFVKGGNPNLTKLRREMLFIELLENVDPKEADLLVSMKDKKLPFKGIDNKLISETFPGLLPE